MMGKRQNVGNIIVDGSFFRGMKRVAMLIVAAMVFGCQEENIPIGLYDYQVIRLLATDSSKVWYRTQYVENGEVVPVEVCQDSVFVSFLFAPSPRTDVKDSVYYYELIRKADCSSLDTILIGKFTASSIDNVFTDSLVFRDGPVDFMIINNITSRFTRLDYQRSGVNISASLEAVQ